MDKKTVQMLAGIGLLGVVGFVIYKMASAPKPAMPVVSAGGGGGSAAPQTAAEIAAAGGALSSIVNAFSSDTSDQSASS